ncbi:hypothetical protein CC1G_02209 [Coprinopsis cinerea okayama7|uniref:Uncharacterized protein n=1 Tax=Coprinopsis cinerea (strain Okayama-7 / 130 / ATCC MYA-4618 / FGSC 9003) TaxID=240176 RepID=A8NKK1_COPC7|nr:hypothetical protein CC1G_02209 [Coprinopsis cinerea okayama7\|eukprot:XP_001834473.2 hypothetical protein CC1G_02209 [Coprinopsis cinerea okayama7\
MALSTTQSVIVFGLIGLLVVALATLFFVLWKRRRNASSLENGYSPTQISLHKLVKQPKPTGDSDTEGLLSRTTTNSGLNLDRRSLHDEIVSMLPELELSDDSQLMFDMREAQGMMLELNRLTTHPGPLRPEDQARITYLRLKLSQLSPELQAFVNGTDLKDGVRSSPAMERPTPSS